MDSVIDENVFYRGEFTRTPEKYIGRRLQVESHTGDFCGKVAKIEEMDGYLCFHLEEVQMKHPATGEWIHPSVRKFAFCTLLQKASFHRGPEGTIHFFMSAENGPASLDPQ